ncbi:uncharacterized protein LOC130670456 [Microplitis mediator]|uniref:uncharacterized protein LOC130670456 n=1 Tax=Microplitis mediator TaxID=375433 RepID=UPI002553ECF6|nr:uncharacterized protein LOC130670456 [Microplitis mediator]
MNEEYLMKEQDKSSSDQGDENSSVAINRQQMREDLRNSFERFNRALEQRNVNISDKEADCSVRPDDYYNPLPVVSPQVAKEVREYLEKGYLPREHDENEDSDESEEMEEEEEEEEEFLRDNENTEEDDDSSEASCSEPAREKMPPPTTP